MMTPAPQPRCGSLVTGAASCPGCQHQDGGNIPSHHTPRVAAGTLHTAASALMESGSSPTLCLRSGTVMCPGRVQPGHSSWEASTPAPPQSCSPATPTPQHQASVCHMRPSNNCVASHCKYLYCYHLHFQLCMCHRVPGPGRGDWRLSGRGPCPGVHPLRPPGAAPRPSDTQRQPRMCSLQGQSGQSCKYCL